MKLYEIIDFAKSRNVFYSTYYVEVGEVWFGSDETIEDFTDNLLKDGAALGEETGVMLSVLTSDYDGIDEEDVGKPLFVKENLDIGG